VATKEELAYEAKVAELRQLAKDNGVDLGGATTKDDIVTALVASRKVKKEDLEALTSDGTSGNVTTASDADVASPTGGANVAGTPQSQLAITQMQDPSGSNIPAANLRQPPSDVGGSPITHSTEALDPMLTRPEEVARERVQGRTSDAATRSADGPQIDEVPPDINAGVKPSDGGAEVYPFPQGGDVDVASVDPGDGKGEFLAPLEVEDWVVLGDHELIPKRLVGRRAIVTDAPRYLVPTSKLSDTWITVRTRDEVNATLTIPLDAVTEIQKGGVSAVVRG